MVSRILEPQKHQFNLFLIVLAAIFLSIATAINWWTQGDGDSKAHFCLWEMVDCNDGVCLVSTANTAGWINFVRLMIIVGLFCFAATLLAICLLIYKPRREFRMATLLFSGIAGGVLSLTGFVVIGFFGRIGSRYNTHSQRLTLDPMALRFQALPLAFIFLSAFISCIVGAFTLVNIDPKKRIIRQSSKKLGEYEMAPIKPIDPIDQKFVKGATNL